MKKKPVVMIDLSSDSIGGGPYTSHYRILTSTLSSQYDFHCLNYKKSLGRNVSIKRVIDLYKQIKKIKPDIVHFSGLQLAGFHFAIACMLAGINRTIVRIHGFSGEAIYFHPLKRVLMTFFMEPLTLLLAKKIYGVSQYVVNKKMVQLFKNKCLGPIYNLPPIPYTATGKDENIRHDLNLDDNCIVAATVGRITLEKGYAILVETIRRLHHLSGLKFLIIGEGDYLQEMKEKLFEQEKQKRVFFLHHRNDVQRILNGCDFFVLPTLHETLSIALLEASSQGLPLIASNTGGVPEIVKNNYNGILVEPGNIDQLVNAIEKMYYDKNLRQRFSVNARELVQTRFCRETILEKIDAAYRALLEH